LAGLNFGGEYYISEHFSVGIEAQGNLTKSDKNSGRFGNPGGVNINLATMIFATMYFRNIILLNSLLRRFWQNLIF